MLQRESRGGQRNKRPLSLTHTYTHTHTHIHSRKSQDFSKAYDKTAMDSFRESREVFAARFSDPKKYAALKQALAEIMYHELRQGQIGIGI